MSDARSEVLVRIRNALSRPLGDDAPEAALPSKAMAYTIPATGVSLADAFTHALEAVSGKVHRVHDAGEALDLLAELLRRRDVKRAAVVKSGLLKNLDIAPLLHDLEIEVKAEADWQQDHKASLRRWLAEVDVSISGAEVAIAETGTLVVAARAGQPRAATLLPPVHIALVGESQIVVSLETLIQDFDGADGMWQASMITLISGPSRSADIEQTLSLGVHGPVEAIVILLTGA